MRTRETIININNGMTDELSSGDVKELQNILILEVLLDIRDLLTPVQNLYNATIANVEATPNTGTDDSSSSK